MGGKIKSWKKRWFVFDRLKRTLSYYAGEFPQTALGQSGLGPLGSNSWVGRSARRKPSFQVEGQRLSSENVRSVTGSHPSFFHIVLALRCCGGSDKLRSLFQMAMLSSLVHTVRKAGAKQRVKYGVWVSLTGNT